MATRTEPANALSVAELLADQGWADIIILDSFGCFYGVGEFRRQHVPTREKLRLH